MFSKWKMSKNISNKNKFPSTSSKRDEETQQQRVYWVNSTVMRADIGSDYIVSEESLIMCHRFQYGWNEQDLKSRIILYQSSGW